MFSKILIANRGAIACRIIRTLRRLGMTSVAVYSEADRHARHVMLADEAIYIGGAAATDSYLNTDRILAAAKASGAQAIHPGYGFLSENPGFAERCEAEQIAFLGPTAAQMRAFGLKHTARELAQQNHAPLLPGSGLIANLEEAHAAAQAIGYPVMLKSTAGGGGIGMRLVETPTALAEAYEAVTRLASAHFKDAGMYLEKFVRQARHIEVQVFGDGMGQVIALGERDCSVQRRNQKVIEETPAPGLSQQQRELLHATSVRLMQAVNYRSAGTVEFVYDAVTSQFYFLEVNTRLQVEHGVTEEVCQVDLVEWMVKLAAGDLPPLATLQPRAQGASIQVRLYAETPHNGFQPSCGTLTELVLPDDVRVDSAVDQGDEVSPHYDPMIAKIIVKADTRDQARQALIHALGRTRIRGIETNLAYLQTILADERFAHGKQTTAMLSQLVYQPNSMDVLDGGLQTTVQDWPGRQGYWHVGVPPSGPMDSLALRAANRLVGNPEGLAALECTLQGPTLRFNRDATLALTGADMQATLDGSPLALWCSVQVRAGSILKLGRVREAGCRAYLAVDGGIDAAYYLGSQSTFTLGQFGGHAGRTLRTADVLPLGTPKAIPTATLQITPPAYTHHWDIGVMSGPHGAPDFFTEEDIGSFFATDWQVHYNSSRTGIRLIGPKPNWARTDGGEAGLHPSNIHDNAYAIGAIDFTGDMPVILGPDGPSLGGFVCPAVVVSAELWKLGQLQPGDTIRFIPLRHQQAEDAHQQLQSCLNQGQLDSLPLPGTTAPPECPILHQLAATAQHPEVVYRQAGDRYLLVEYGPLMLDIALRFRVQALMNWLQEQHVNGIIDLTPGIRSLQIHFDEHLSRPHLLNLLQQAETQLAAIDDMTMPSRIVHLPLSWDDASTKLAIEKYMQSVRPDAPWCPSNIEFIGRINGLDSVEQVQNIVFNASYLVLGLGDVYLGAPVATPIDPRHRLVTTKYNPARTWTPENAVGIGGAYMCVYGMEGPGGYQFVGRTLQMWNRYRTTDDFAPGQPWLLRFFDQIRFYPVSEQELADWRRDFLYGKVKLKVEDSHFSLADYQAFLGQHADSIQQFKTLQQQAFDAERERWKANGQADYLSEDSPAAPDSDDAPLPDGQQAIAAHVPGNIWKTLVQPGDTVSQGQALVVIESMKMEFVVHAPAAGHITQLGCQTGQQVSAGQRLLVWQPAG